MKGLGVFLVGFWAVALFAFAQEDNTSATKTDSVQKSPVVLNPQVEPEPLGGDGDCCRLMNQNALFPGGENAMLRWIKEHLQYPKDCEKEGVEGRVMVSFVVFRDGTIEKIQTIRSPHSSLSKEAERVVATMPSWRPAIEEGEWIPKRFILPIVFKLEESASEDTELQENPEKD